jgi:serine/threonine protein kinase
LLRGEENFNKVLQISKQILQAVDAVHRAGFVWRDCKPEVRPFLIVGLR